MSLLLIERDGENDSKRMREGKRVGRLTAHKITAYEIYKSDVTAGKPSRQC